MIDINSLSRQRKQMEKKREEVYKKILLRIHNKIKIANKLNDFCYYEIPNIVLGMPLFNINKCSDYVFDKLIKQGFKVTRVKYNNFMIYWGHINNEDNNNNNNNHNNNEVRSLNNSEFRNIKNITNNSKNFIYDI